MCIVVKNMCMCICVKGIGICSKCARYNARGSCESEVLNLSQDVAVLLYRGDSRTRGSYIADEVYEI